MGRRRCPHGRNLHVSSESNASRGAAGTAAPLNKRPTTREVWRAAFFAMAIWIGVFSLAPSGALDARVLYGVAEPLACLEGLGATGREAYLVAAIADLLLIAAYTRLAWTLWRYFGASDRMPAIVFAPACFDLIETTGVLVLLTSFPEHPMAVAIAVTVATPLKWVSLVGLVLALGLRGRGR